MSAPFRVLFVANGVGLAPLPRLLPALAREHGREISARSLLLQDLADGRVAPSEARRLLSWADAVLYDVRESRETLALLRAERHNSLDTLFVPLAGGPPAALALCRMGSLDLSPLEGSEGRPAFPHKPRRALTRLMEGIGQLVPVGALRDARTHLRVLRYWAAGGERNLERLLHLLLREYAGGQGPAPARPEERPACRIEDPASGVGEGSAAAWLARHGAQLPSQEGLPWVALLYDAGSHREASTLAADALQRALQRHARVLPLACDGLESLEGLRGILDEPACPCLDALVSLLWYRLDGGPLAGDPGATLRTLDRLDVPVLVPAALYCGEFSRWHANPQGLGPMEARTAAALPELDGALPAPPVVALETFEQDGLRAARPVLLDERVAHVAARVAAWVELRHTARGARRLAFLVPGARQRHRAGFDPRLDLRASLAAIFEALAQAGYEVGESGADPLGALLADGVHGAPGGADWRGERWLLEDYLLAWRELPPPAAAELEEAWGPPPGLPLLDGPALPIPGRWFGRAFVGFLPELGLASRGTHAPDRSPPPDHAALALYRYLRECGTQLVVHLGCGPERLPGKAAGLSCTCWPDVLLGPLPALRAVATDDPASGGLARRRGHALALTHRPPELALPSPTDAHAALLARLERACGGAGSAQAQLEAEASAALGGLGIEAGDSGSLAAALRALWRAPVREGMHVLGRAPDGLAVLAWLLQRARAEASPLWTAAREQAGEAGADALLERWLREALAEGRLREPPAGLAHEALAQDLLARAAEQLAELELPGLLRALDGRWLPPGAPSGAASAGRNASLPDPTGLPEPEAVERGATLGAALLAEHRSTCGMHLETAALVLRGGETAGTGGEALGLALHLLGARVCRSPGWPPHFEPLPMERIERPRVDLIVLLDGAARDLFPELLLELDRLIRQIASLAEPAALNPLRAQLELEAGALGGELAGARLFGPAPGNAGLSLPTLLRAGSWRDGAALGAAFARAHAFAWGERLAGQPAQQALERRLARCQLVAQLLPGEDDPEGLDLCWTGLGGAARAVTAARGAAPRAVLALAGQPRPLCPCCAAARFAERRLLDPAWIEALLRHPGQAAPQLEERLARLLGHAATLGVSPAIFEQASALLIEDEGRFARLRTDAPEAAAAMAARLLEAARRGFWQPEAQTREVLERAAGG